MKKIILFLTFAALLFAGCAKVQNEEVVPVEGKRHVTLKATVDTGTRVSIDESGYYGWQKGDGIVVLTNQGAVYGTTQSLGITASFDLDLDQGETFGDYAFYPGNPEWMEQDLYGIKNGVLQYFLDWEYLYVQDATFMPMLGNVTSDGATFRSMGGVLKVPVSAVPDNATWFRFTVNDKMEGNDVKINGIFSVVNGVISAEPLTDLSGGSNFTNIRLPYEEEDRNAIEAFYIPLPVGTYKNFTFSFVKEGLDGDERTIFSKTAEVGGAGLEVNRNDIIVTPTLVVDLNPPSGISFSTETLQYFPGLLSNEPKIWIPKDLVDQHKYSFPFGIISGSNCSVSVSEDWLEVIPDKEGTYQSAWLSCDLEYSVDPRTATIVITCDGCDQLTIQVEEYYVLTMKKNDNPLQYYGSIYLTEHSSYPFTVDVQVPDGMTIQPDTWYWSLQNNNGPYLSLTPDSGSPTTTVNAIQPGQWVRLESLVYLEDSVQGSTIPLYTGCWIAVDKYHIPLYYNGEDQYDGYIEIMTGATPITLTADLSALSEDDIDFVEWYADGDYEWYNGARQEYVGGSILSFTDRVDQYPIYSTKLSASSSGYDYACFRVYYKNGTFDETYCEIGVEDPYPIDLFWGDEKVTEVFFSVPPGEPITLRAVLNTISVNDIDMSSPPYWYNVSDYQLNENTGMYEYIDDDEDTMTLTADPDDPFKVTVFGPEGTADEIALHVHLINDGQIFVPCKVYFGYPKAPKQTFKPKDSFERSPLVLKRESRHHSR